MGQSASVEVWYGIVLEEDEWINEDLFNQETIDKYTELKNEDNCSGEAFEEILRDNYQMKKYEDFYTYEEWSVYKKEYYKKNKIVSDFSCFGHWDYASYYIFLKDKRYSVDSYETLLLDDLNLKVSDEDRENLIEDCRKLGIRNPDPKWQITVKWG